MSEPFDAEGFVRYFNRRLDQFAKGEHNLKTPVLDTLELLKDSLDVALIAVKHGPGREALEREFVDKLSAQFGDSEETLSVLNSLLDAFKELRRG